jgi:hypothetical protein
MAPSLDFLRSQIFNRFVELALDNTDGHSTDELRREASRQIVAETREQHRANVLAASPINPTVGNTDDADGALDTIVAKIWKILVNQRVSKKLIKPPKSTITKIKHRLPSLQTSWPTIPSR